MVPAFELYDRISDAQKGIPSGGFASTCSIQLRLGLPQGTRTYAT